MNNSKWEAMMNRVNNAFTYDLSLDDEELEFLKSEGYCVENYQTLKNFANLGQCGEDADCNECWSMQIKDCR